MQEGYFYRHQRFFGLIFGAFVGALVIAGSLLVLNGNRGGVQSAYADPSLVYGSHNVALDVVYYNAPGAGTRIGVLYADGTFREPNDSGVTLSPTQAIAASSVVQGISTSMGVLNRTTHSVIDSSGNLQVYQAGRWSNYGPLP